MFLRRIKWKCLICYLNKGVFICKTCFCDILFFLNIVGHVGPSLIQFTYILTALFTTDLHNKDEPRAEAADGVICLSFVVLHRGYMQRWGWVTNLVFRCDYVMTTQVLMQGWSHKEQMVRCRRSRQVRSVCQGKHRLCDAAALLQPQSPVTLIYTTALWDTGDDRTNNDCDFPSLTCCALSVRKLVIHWQTAEQLMFMLQNRIKSKKGKRKKEKGMWRNGYLVLVMSFD